MRARHLLIGLLVGCGGEPQPERVTPWSAHADPAEAPAPPCTAADLGTQLLSETGCFDGKQPGEGFEPYEIRAPLWSDRAAKDRWVALPEGTAFSVSETGKLTLPPGGVAAKHFARDGVDLETRFVARGEDGITRFYTYVWDGDEAWRLRDGAVVGDWEVPTEADCITCHGDPGLTLGLEARQLHTDGDSTLARWIHMGWVDRHQLDPPSALETLATYDGPRSVEERARSYLHANCASCHQPKGSAFTDIDLRVFAPLRLTGTCRRVAETWAVGGSSVLVEPGSPETSVLYLRMQTTSEFDRMPSLGTVEPDPVGLDLVEQWIAGLEDCDS